MRRPALGSVLLAAAGIIAAALVGELALRGVAAASAPLGRQLRGFDPMGIQIEPHGAFGYRQVPNARYHYLNNTVATSNALGFRGPVVRVPKPAGTYRVVLLGGSTTHGWGVPDDETIDAYMRPILGARLPGTRVEVVNLAFDGYDSLQLLERLLSDGIRLQPDLLIVNEGINDVRNARLAHLRARDPRTLIWETDLARLREERRRGGPTLWTRVKHLSLLARTPGFVREQLRRRAAYAANHARGRARPLAAGVVGTAAAAAGVAGPPYPEAAERFEANVREIVALAAQRGIPVILSTPPSALRELPPTATSTQSYWITNARVTQQVRDTLEGRLRRIADDERRAGHAVRHVALRLPLRAFLDDCHLTGAGNRRLAQFLSDTVAAMLGPSFRGRLAHANTATP